MNDIIAVGTDNALYIRRGLTGPYTQIPNSGSVIAATILNDGRLLGVGTDNKLYTRETLASPWVVLQDSWFMPVLKVIQLRSGTFVGIGTDKHVYSRKDFNSPWTFACPGLVLDIAELATGAFVAVGNDNTLYSKNTLDQTQWQPFSFRTCCVKSVAQLESGQLIAVGINNKLYTKDILSLGATSEWAYFPDGDVIDVEPVRKPPKETLAPMAAPTLAPTQLPITTQPPAATQLPTTMAPTTMPPVTATPSPSTAPTSPPTMPPAPTCPLTVKENDVVLDGTTGQVFKVVNGTLRQLQNSAVYRAMGSPSYTPYGTELQACPRGPILQLEDVTKAPVTVAPTTAPPVTKPPVPPQIIRTPNLVVFAHRHTWMEYGRLVLLGLQNGYGIVDSFRGLENVFRINTDGTIQSSTDAFLTVDDDCTAVQTSLSTGPNAQWRFVQQRDSPLHFTLSSISCNKPLGFQPVGGNKYASVDNPAQLSSWFIIPISQR